VSIWQRLHLPTPDSMIRTSRHFRWPRYVDRLFVAMNRLWRKDHFLVEIEPFNGGLRAVYRPLILHMSPLGAPYGRQCILACYILTTAPSWRVVWIETPSVVEGLNSCLTFRNITIHSKFRDTIFVIFLSRSTWMWWEKLHHHYLCEKTRCKSEAVVLPY
jgi:hypothetical protein